MTSALKSQTTCEMLYRSPIDRATFASLMNTTNKLQWALQAAMTTDSPLVTRPCVYLQQQQQ